MKKEYLIIIILAVTIVYGCTNHLDKKYSAKNYKEDLVYFEKKGVKLKDIESIKFYLEIINGDTTKISGMTYHQILEAAQDLQDKLVKKYKKEYLIKKDSLNLESKLNLIEKILTFEPEDKFAKNELGDLDKKRKEKIIKLKNDFSETKNRTKKIELCEEILKLKMDDTTTNINLIELYIDKGYFKKAKKQIKIIRDKRLVSDSIYLNLSEKYLVRKNIYSIVKITKRKMSSKSSNDIDDNSSILDRAIASGPNWSKSTNINGFVTNTSKTLTLNVNIKVRFTIEVKTSVTFLITMTKRETKTKTKNIYFKGLKPGESKSFSTSINLNQTNYDVASSNSTVKDVNISAIIY